MRFAVTLLAPLALSLQVSAHGFIQWAKIDGKTYKGNGDGGDPSTTAIRPTKPYDVGPVVDVNDKQMSCGLSPVSNAALVADANAGSSVEVLWGGEGGTHWIHEVGPVMHYMAECTGVDDCTTFDASNAKWFKIDEQGLSGSKWPAMESLFNGQPVKFTIPENLKKGNYLLRSEVIALHRANVEGGAEFYPNCVQLKVGGSGTETPSKTVKFPGAYSATDPGILTPDIFNPGFTYSFPGGPLSSLVSSESSSSGSSSDDDSSSTSKAASSATAKASDATSTKKAASSTGKAATSTAAVAEPTTTKAASASTTNAAAASSSAAASTSTGRCKAKNTRRRAEKKRQADEALARRNKTARAHHNARMFGHKQSSAGPSRL
ncbi:lytic polysaccharide monooxygenase [Peniophora sp. CONT]|nr:lytic polysaccharide monooxygenase [Peniophora sp. CONT]